MMRCRIHPTFPGFPDPLGVIFRIHQGGAQRNSIAAKPREGRRPTRARESAPSSATGARFMLGGWQAASGSRAKPVARAGPSKAACRALSPAEKLETLFGCSLDRAFEVLSWPAVNLGPVWHSGCMSAA
jgi:hypothetical protein